jgi:hypothetical protein
MQIALLNRTRELLLTKAKIAIAFFHNLALFSIFAAIKGKAR